METHCALCEVRTEYVKDMPAPHHVELALYADDTAIIVTSRKPALLVTYPESLLSDLERWLREWRIVINVSKSTAMIFAWVSSTAVHGANQLGRHSPLSGGDARYTAGLVDSYRSG